MDPGLPQAHAVEPWFWPDQALPVAAMRERGVPRLPFVEFLLKVHSRCNLACDYCYVYEGPDQSWREQPRTMSGETADLVCARIAEHVRTHRLDRIRVVLHGGEPLLAGVSRIGHLVGRLRATLPAGTRADVLLQTNGLLLGEEVLAFCRAHGIRIGISLDGGPSTQDRHRKRPDGRGSHASVGRALRLLTQPRHRDLWTGLLAVVDLASDPVETCRQLTELGPPAVDLLLPLAHWGSPPPGHRAGDPSAAPYGDWLTAFFDAWYHEPAQPVRVPFFEAVIDALLGGHSATEALGGGPARMVVVETDGSLTLSDLLKSAYPGAATTGRHLRSHSFDDLLDHPGVVARQLGAEGLAPECRACPVMRVCGGGLYAHRYRPGSGFLHPSVYCADLQAVISHVGEALRADLARLDRALPARPMEGR
ncbi:FxsB family cyclophane-forming radical SAM/SPASM peptide maturase [Streptomyces sp. NBC_00102]|uniref:FxsB family cyclophane-forming radical SAM/SPASM peptide maturase n=1 Tax=Streptomyces sp. NBC_00102 TaxID=2975652 RepID=UPI0022564127|nr:FxsB family cyclophane-forming radical SAM/SPASM peptide maturase [Streptomyces sp. NBC_00102]MCX5400539.1 FxsB family radical SAM/SPASM domain protein [Streptomyces sp. NBC_00102]